MTEMGRRKKPRDNKLISPLRQRMVENAALSFPGQ